MMPHQGKGAAAARRRFGACWFNEETCQAGIEALGWYHQKRDAARGRRLGPNLDWASHAADAFGLMCVAYEEPRDGRVRPGVEPGRPGG